MVYTQRFTEYANLGAKLDPDSYAADTHDTSFVSMRDYHRAVFLVSVGDFATGGTVTASIRQAKDTAGASAKAITGKAAVALTDADDDKVIVIELRTEELDAGNGFDCISGRVVVGVDAVEVSALLLRTEPRFAPVATTNFDEVVD